MIVRGCPQHYQVRRCPQALMARTQRSADSPSHTFAGKSESKRLSFRRANDNDVVIVTVAVTIIATVRIHYAERFEKCTLDSASTGVSTNVWFPKTCWHGRRERREVPATLSLASPRASTGYSVERTIMTPLLLLSLLLLLLPLTVIFYCAERFEDCTLDSDSSEVSSTFSSAEVSPNPAGADAAIDGRPQPHFR